MFGIKLLPVSGKMVSSAKTMLDTEMEYIEYLRNRKRFFFMTQVQQTRVKVVSKKAKQAEEKKDKKSSGLLGNLLKRKLKKKLLKKKRLPKKKNILNKARRNMRAKGLRMGRKVNRVLKIDKAKKFIGNQTKKLGKNVKNIGKNVASKGLKAGKNILSKGGNLVNRIIPKSAKKKVAQKLIKTATKKGLQKAGAKVATKIAAKSAVKIGLKKIPVVGLIAGLGFGAQRLLKGDIAGALMEAGSGIASTIPGPGTAISAGIDAALIAKDVTGMKDSG